MYSAAGRLDMGEHGTAVYSDQVKRVSLTMVLASLAVNPGRTRKGPIRFKVDDDEELLLELVTAPWKGGADRATLLRCPGCGRAVRMVGHHVLTGWACRLCGRWRYRSEAQIKTERAVAISGVADVETGERMHQPTPEYRSGPTSEHAAVSPIESGTPRTQLDVARVYAALFSVLTEEPRKKALAWHIGAQLAEASVCTQHLDLALEEGNAVAVGNAAARMEWLATKTDGLLDLYGESRSH